MAPMKTHEKQRGFKLTTDLRPAGDQPRAIEELVVDHNESGLVVKGYNVG
jgi:excinuclease UvrABC helicase subunit UvrB